MLNSNEYENSTAHQKVSEYDQEIPQKHTKESQNTKDDCKTRNDTKYCITKQGPNTDPHKQ